MYRRDGRVVTGGVDGNALWLEEWHNWFDSDSCTALIQDLGFNILHSRFYKGMGWDYESQDFPNVKKFVKNCHNHGIKVLAYVQFGTLYYETMQNEVPDLEDWAAIDQHGEKYIYQGFPNSYYRWIPCINNQAFEEYLKKVIRIALVDGDFDGILYDNCFVPPCYCSRCQAKFREYLSKVADPVKDLGLPSVEYIRLPYSTKESSGEVEDPITQRWLQFRCENSAELFKRLYNYAKSCKPDAIISGNSPLRADNNMGARGLNPLTFGSSMDIFFDQSSNAPGIEDGFIINRIREYKLAKALNKQVLGISEKNFFSRKGPLTEEEARAQSLHDEFTLLEDIIFGGIPFDRTVFKPDKEMVSPLHLKFQRPMLKRFNEVVSVNYRALAAQSYTPVKILFSNESVMFSKKSNDAILGIEEILLRNHIPYGLLTLKTSEPLIVPSDCEVLLVCGQHCLSDAVIDSLKHYAQNGGRLIVTGASGEYDEYYRQRRDNPLIESLSDCKNVVFRTEGYNVPIESSGSKIKAGDPGKSAHNFLEDIYKIWIPEIVIQAPATTFVDIKKDGESYYVHLLNYSKKSVESGSTSIQIHNSELKLTKGNITVPLENRTLETTPFKKTPDGCKSVMLPGFDRYAIVTFE
jgi:hypothetical protein